MRTSYVAIIIAVVIVAIGIIQIERPLTKPIIVANIPVANHIQGHTPTLPWPKGVQADVDIPNVGSFGEQGPTSATPIGSMTKMMTAYLVLKAHPLSTYAQGPSILVTAADAALYQSDASTQQSVMPMVAGEKLSERKLLEGLLVASGNNVATMLADWVGGSPTHFAQMMNHEAQALGLSQTHFEGPSGLNPANVSTAANQVTLSEIMMQNPAFAQIVAMPQMTDPGQNAPIENYNYLIGHDGIIGVKTGSTLESGGCVVLAGQRGVGSTSPIIYVGIVGQPGTQSQSQLIMSLNAGQALYNAASQVVGKHTVLAQGTTVGYLKVPWQSTINLVAAKTITLMGWPGLSYRVHLTTHSLTATQTIPAGTVIGTLTVKTSAESYTIPVRTQTALIQPSFTYRIERH